MTPLQAAKEWIAQDYYPIPIQPREKKPTVNKWGELRITEENAAEYFNSDDLNIGLLWGVSPSGTDYPVDIDCDSVYTQRAARFLLPPTGLVYGHESSPASHYIFRINKPEVTMTSCSKATGESFGEFRCCKKDGSIGIQTVVPPSTNRETGELLRFEPGLAGRAASVPATQLVTAYRNVQAAAQLAECWPKRGTGRHECELALAGVMAKNRWPLEAAIRFVLAVYNSADSPDKSALGRVRDAVKDTYRKFEETGGATTAWPTLIKHVGKPAADAAEEWLDLRMPVKAAAVPQGASAVSTEAPAPKLTVTSLYDVFDLPDTSADWLIKDLLPYPCLGILAGRPKGGKSYVALQMALSVARKEPFLGWFEIPNLGKVLYLALEEHPGRTRNRMHKLIGDEQDVRSRNVDMVYAGELRPLMAGGYDQVEEIVADGAYNLVIIDTKLALVQRMDSKGSDIVRADYEEMNRLHGLARKYNTTVMVIDHTRKGESDNHLDNVIGTTGVTAVADAVWTLNKDGKKAAILKTTCRDTEELPYALKREASTSGWYVKEAGALVGASEDRRAIERFLAAAGPSTVIQIAAELGKKRAATRKMLQRMDHASQVRLRDGKYESVGGPVDEDDDGE